ncbi:MAG TPA: NADH-quinone oxidoreductase subunit L [Acidimicrobiia bacterium]|nr:NADH-quinone oxidoreductase subunit L [Acidimicrobiia bacterium]
MLQNAWLVPSLPAASFLAILLFGKRAGRQAAWWGIGAVGASFVAACVAAGQWIQRVDDATGRSQGLAAFAKGLPTGGAHTVVRPVTESVTWWQNGGVKFGVGTYVDGLTVLMLVVVTLISLLVQIYSTAYMRGDRRYTWYFAALSLFTASMLTLVVAENTVELLVGWELVGLCSFMLIGHWWEEPENSRAAIKAFLTTRTGDIGLMIGIIVLFFAVGSFGVGATNLYASGSHAHHDLLLAAAVCLMVAIIGKSGQFPLHTWLPDAMAGPTPVSALIHAATMVVAGVFLGARLYPVLFNGFSIAHGGVNFMALIGGVTILVGAVLAFVQHDIKKVLAYSTISQLGYMVLALGVGAWTAAIFHLFTHAFFKALLFLGAGSVSHSAGHSFDMREMGGLRKPMPITFWTFVIGSLALAGIFPLAGFWSKDEILVNAGANGYTAFLVLGLIGAFLTAAYMTRAVYLTFFGEFRGHGQPHESERAITTPLVVLGALSVGAGLVNAAPLGLEKIKDWVEPTFAFPSIGHAAFDYPKAVLSVGIALVAIGVAAYYWFRRDDLPALSGLTERSVLARRGYTLLVNKLYLDDLYEKVIIAGIRGPVARIAYWIDQNVIDGVVNGLGRGAVVVARYTYAVVDQRLVDGAVNELAHEAGAAGGELSRVQSGRLQRYALLLFAGVGVLSLALLLTNTI